MLGQASSVLCHQPLQLHILLGVSHALKALDSCGWVLGGGFGSTGCLNKTWSAGICSLPQDAQHVSPAAPASHDMQKFLV